MKSKPLLLALVLAAALLIFGPCVRRAAIHSLRVEPSAGTAHDAVHDGLSSAEADGSRAPAVDGEKLTFTSMSRWGTAPIRLLVVERESGRHIPGASVSFLAADPRHRRFVIDGPDWIGTDPEAFLHDHGRTVVADDRGEVEIPASSESLLVCGRADDRFGWTTFWPYCAGDRRLELERQRDLVVRVVDDQGVPLEGVGIGLCRCGANGNSWQGWTDAAGRASIHDLTSVIRAASFEDEHAIEVHAEIPANPRIAQWLDPRHLPSEPVELVVPACGRLRVDVVDADGQPWHQPGQMFLRPASAKGVEYDPDQRKVWTIVPFDDAASVATWVPVGVDLEVTLEFDVGGDTSGTATGPRAKGEESVARFALDPQAFFVVGRLVDEAGVPVAQTSFRLRSFWYSAGGLSNTADDPLRTDGGGHFVITRPSTTAWILEHPTERNSRGLKLDFTKMPTSGMHDLGDLPLVRLEPLVTGRVEDEQGRPIAGAGVSLNFKAAALDHYDRRIGGMYPTGPSGEFFLYVPCLDGALSLSAYSEESRHLSRESTDSFTCRNPASEHVLRLETLGAVEGSALFDDGRRMNDIELRLSNDPNYVEATGSIVANTFRFRFAGVTSGLHTLSVVERQGEATVLEIPNIVVRAGEMTHDPRLEPLDLRHALHGTLAPEMEIGIVDEAGRSVSFGDVWVWVTPSTLFDRWQWANGHVRIPSAGVSALDVSAIGRRVAHLDLADPRDPIVLRPACDVAIVLERPQPLVDAGFRFSATLSPLAEDKGRHLVRMDLSPARPGANFDALGQARFRLALPGQFELHVNAIRQDPSTGEPTLEEQIGIAASCAHVDVRDDDGLQRFDVRFDAQELNSFLESLKQPKEDR